MTERCEAICSTHGQRCRAPANYLADGLRVCGRHKRGQGPEADGDGLHVYRVNDMLIEAMRHQDWSATPVAVRHLIERAWVELGLATGDDT